MSYNGSSQVQARTGPPNQRHIITPCFSSHEEQNTIPARFQWGPELTKSLWVIKTVMQAAVAIKYNKPSTSYGVGLTCGTNTAVWNLCSDPVGGSQ